MKYLLLVFCLISFSLCIVEAQIELEGDPGMVKKYMNTITAEELKDHLYTIASDDYEGRETGTKGQAMAANYISKHFLDNGLYGPMKDNPNPYFQTIPFRAKQVGTAEMGNENYQLNYPNEFVSSSLFNMEAEGVDLVFIGYGIEKEGYNDFEGLNIEGKGVVLLDGPIKEEKTKEMIGDRKRLRSRINEFKEKGAAFVVVTYPSEEEFQTRFAYFGAYASKPRLSMGAKDDGSEGYPQFLVSPTALAKLMGESPEKFFKTLQKNLKKGKPLGGLYSTKVNASVSYANRLVTSDNVLGYLEGTDLKDELLVITAHYDHVGINDGKVYNGADDDGSGTVGLLEVVNAFATAAKDGNRPRRSILFMTVTGEEKGLLGSRYYSENPVYDMDKTITNLNIDMIGRVDPDHENDPNYVYIIGSTMLSADLHNVHEAVSSTYLPDFKMDYKYNSKDDPNRFYYRSDHYNFAKNDIPVIFYFNGTHEDYHQATDTPDKINYEVLAKRAQLVFATAWELANRDKKPALNE